MRLLTPLVSITLIPFLIAPLPAQTSLPAEALQPAQALQIRLVEGDGSTVPAGSTSKKGFTVEVSDGSGRAIADAAVAFRLPDSGATGVFQDGGHANVAYTDSAGRAHFSGIRWSTAAGAASIRITASKGNAHAGMLLEENLSAATAAVVLAAVTPVTPVTPAAATVAPITPAVSVTPPPSIPRATAIAPATSVMSPNSAPPQPGKVDPITTGAQSPAKILPARAAASATQTTSAPSEEPAVSVTHSSTGAGATHSSKTKWIILAAVVAAGVGAAVALAGKGSSSSTTSSSSLSIGSPTVSIGHP